MQRRRPIAHNTVHIINERVDYDLFSGPFHGAIAVPSVTRCRCRRRRRGHRCAGVVRQ